VKEYNKNCLFCVDGITGVLTKEIDLSKHAIDVLVAGSQKAFMLPTGLSLIYMSELAETKLEEAKLPRFYFDLRKEKKAYEKGQTFFSSPVNLYFALEKSLEYIHKKGLKKHLREIEKRAHSIRGALKAIGLKLATEKPAPALTAFWVPESIDGKKLRLHLEEKYRITFMGGQDAWAGKVIRIGHIGFLSEEDLQYAVESICDALNEFGYEADKQRALIALEQSWDGSND
jgi:aspartate aminotransferase-like enzyme